MQDFDLVIVGGGAAGFFTAVNCAEQNRNLKIAILEKGKSVLEKVKISGGGRCNLCHACFDPAELVEHYPRGSKALLGPFHHFCSGDTIEWFEQRGLKTKIEEDGRMFPVSNSSQSVVDCLWNRAKKFGVQVFTQCRLDDIAAPNGNKSEWLLTTSKGEFKAKALMLTTGSNPRIWKHLARLGHEIVPPVPSLFTFNIKDERIKGLAGISVGDVEVKIPSAKLEANGPLLITHWGLSGPAILKLSAWGARALQSCGYKFEVQLNWLYPKGQNEIVLALKALREQQAKKQVRTNSPFDLSSRLWKQLIDSLSSIGQKRWLDLSNKDIDQLAQVLCCSILSVNGKSTFKEEFVTAGGVHLDEINFKTFGSKLYENLFMAGEILNIDAVTGGFNFQAAWTGAWIAARAIAKKNKP